MNKRAIIVLTALLVIGISTRFLFLIDGESVLPNFTAIGAVALFGANYFKGIYRYFIPITALWLSDLVLNNVVYTQYYDSYQLFGSPWVYGALLLTVIIGIVIMRKPSWKNLIIACLGSGIIFYLVTNFAVWISPASPYTKDFAGMIHCYSMALPFFRNTLLGNFFYAFLLFGAYEYIAQRYLQTDTSRLLSTI